MRTNAPELGADLLVDFLNTLDVEDDVDQLADDEGHRRWASEHGLEPGDRATTQQARDALRAIVDGDASPAGLPALTLPVDAAPGAVGLSPRTAADAAVASALVLSIQGKLGRVRLCGGEDCRWAFYDASRNGSRQWCSMEVCGNRQKARTYRSKERDGA
ncbi:Putative stress-induced transcription regulator [Leifsonia sp. 98AMF]|uniref:CGNR zinc finger domain-containing protein n=1 Tax=Microbacteriaceae TaxID=85023 RepID=UPI00037D245F|nr:MULTISPECIES: CGNR zinc finger domain-containing protein [Microbacteriaceae]SDH30838.1 Putative stress-induced transcription regulator [Leifsonia sp. 197AMF]SDJ03637.1 Putative stress-induced transcription regulator [Leifsonia sp. 466MF]SDJ69179.1 Putative stress-induced transcription regulator [Leifsonia sp. 157MF]SDO07435.1 Putative stress-induced transcription regulator [Leifsonia sp. 509MF]SEM96455.1 Putative stress-induced transcription regulator [Leifsonia sp. 467MF]